MTSAPATPSTRGTNFTSEEFEAIAKAWMHASENSITGAEQKGATFYKTVHDLYNDVYKPSNKLRRPVSSITNKSKDLHKECFPFTACYMRVIRLRPSGTSSEDLVRLATAQYNNCIVTSPTDDCGPTFRYLSAWEVFRKHEKFMCAVEEKSKGSSTFDADKASATEKPSEGGAVLISDDKQDDDEKSQVSGKLREKPVGRRKAKELFVQQQLRDHKIKVAQALVETQKDRNKTLKRQVAIQLFTNPATGCDASEAAEFF